MCNTECKQIAFKRVIFYLKDSKISDLGNLYPVIELETMHFGLLRSDNIHYNNHTATFDLLVKYVPGLNKKTANKCVSIFFDTAVIGLNMSWETYFDNLVKIIGPVRKAMHLKCQEYSLSLYIDLQIQFDFVPI